MGFNLRVAIDILTPKQGMFLSKLSNRLEEEGHQVFRITREYREVLELLKLKGIDVITVGKHGGGTLSGKLKAYASRVLRLSSLVEELKPDIAISFSSPEMARVAFGLGIPHICINDSPHAEAIARLTLPLSKILFTPKIIPKKSWVRFGIPSEDIIQYNALDPWTWLKDFKPDRKILELLNLDESKPILTFRTEESYAAYLLGKALGKVSITPIIQRLMEEGLEAQIVILPRYREQIAALKEDFGTKAVVCDSLVDGPSLLHYTTVFVGAGGTMSIEAALLGVPTFSCYPGEPFLIEKYLMGKGLIIREKSAEETTEGIIKTLKRIDPIRRRQSERAERLVQKFEDPIKVITDNVAKLTNAQGYRVTLEDSDRHDPS